MRNYIFITFLFLSGCAGTKQKGDFTVKIFNEDGSTARIMMVEEYEITPEGLKIGEEIITESYLIEEEIN